MPSYYIKANNTPANIATLNSLNAAGLLSKNPTDYVTTHIHLFWNLANVTKTTVKNVFYDEIMKVENEIAVMNTADLFLLVDVSSSNYLANQTVLDSLDGAVVYTTPELFSADFPSKMDLTINKTKYLF